MQNIDKYRSGGSTLLAVATLALIAAACGSITTAAQSEPASSVDATTTTSETAVEVEITKPAETTTTEAVAPSSTVPVTTIPVTTEAVAPSSTVPVTTIPVTTEAVAPSSTVPVTTIPVTTIPVSTTVAEESVEDLETTSTQVDVEEPIVPADEAHLLEKYPRSALREGFAWTGPRKLGWDSYTWVTADGSSGIARRSHTCRSGSLEEKASFLDPLSVDVCSSYLAMEAVPVCRHETKYNFHNWRDQFLTPEEFPETVREHIRNTPTVHGIPRKGIRIYITREEADSYIVGRTPGSEGVKPGYYGDGDKGYNSLPKVTYFSNGGSSTQSELIIEDEEKFHQDCERIISYLPGDETYQRP